MLPTARDAYLETQILTATPQRLRLMLIDGAMRKINAAIAAFENGDEQKAITDIGQCRDIVAELIAGIDPEQTPVAKQVLAVYAFLYSTLVDAQFGRKASLLPEALRVLAEEQKTWQAVCEQMPERLTPIVHGSHEGEELAPQRVAETWSAGYSSSPSVQQRESAFSLDA